MSDQNQYQSSPGIVPLARTINDLGEQLDRIEKLTMEIMETLKRAVGDLDTSRGLGH